jgi:hypothetical protein
MSARETSELVRAAPITLRHNGQREQRFIRIVGSMNVADDAVSNLFACTSAVGRAKM